MAEEARQAGERQWLDAGILRPAVRQAVAGRLNVALNEVNSPLLGDFLKSREGAEWYLNRLKEADISVAGLTPDRVTGPARPVRGDGPRATPPAASRRGRGRDYGIQERMLWLILVSMVVCAVGIANAMLMSVTERFREIATLKCLGALDGTIHGHVRPSKRRCSA